ncbi:hypothetical protein FQR65_LT17612 [Abscondita terminalis]|nr:hypothetical protein FQR65_LT17612 [Abscondita terminalis]
MQANPNVAPDIYNEYFKKTIFARISDDRYAIIFSTTFSISIIKEFKDFLNEQINVLLETPNTISLFLMTQEQYDDEIEKIKLDDKINKINYSDHSFKNFVVGDSNRDAYQAIKLIEDTVSASFNPLFIYGKSGLGKTHLIKALKNSLNTRRIPVYLESSEQFRNDYVNSLKDTMREVEDLKKDLYKNKIFIIDDIQTIVSSQQTISFYFDVFNKFYEENKQIIIISDTAPNSLPGLKERLVSRFVGGLVIEIKSIDETTKRKIIQSKLDNLNISVSEDVIDYIVAYHSSNVREIEGILNVITFFNIQNKHSESTNQIITFKDIEKQLTSRQSTITTGITIEKIKKFIADEQKITITSLESKSRIKEIANARFLAMYFAQNLLKMQLSEIGRHFGGRDHSTVSHAIGQIEKKMSEKNFLNYVNSLKKKISKRIAIEVKNDEILLKSANESLSLKINLSFNEVEIKEIGNVLVKPKYLIDILKKMDDEIVTLSSLEDNILKINGSKNEFLLNILDHNEFPILGFRESGSFVELKCQELKKGLNFNLEDKLLFLTSTDTHRISKKELIPISMLKEEEKINVTVPYKTCLELLKLIPETGNIKIYFNDNYISFIFEGVVLQSVLIEGIYPDVSKVFPDDFNTKLFVQNKTFLKLINRADISTEEEKQIKINLKLQGKSLYTKSNSVTIGSFIEEFNEFTIKGIDEFNIVINSKYILDALKSFSTEGIEIQINDSKKPIIVSSTEDESLKHVIMLVNAD